MRAISSKNAPDAIGPYSQAVASGSLLFISGQIAIDPATNQMIDGDISTQTDRVLKNIDAVLVAAGTNRQKILSCTVYLRNLADFAAFNMRYAEFFGKHKPARATVEVGNLPKGALIEISAISELSNTSPLQK